MLLATAAWAQVTETVLPNGLTVLVKEVHAAPVVTVDLWVRAGSRNEPVGMTGSSHLLEHMTYKGTKEFAKDDMRNLNKRNGAVDNGATFYDYTHYYTTIASDRVDLPLRMEASRLRNALIKQSDLDNEMTVVRSELEGRENQPGTQLFTAVMAAAFQSHPYRWPVVGWRADIEHVKADALRAYYRTYYVPNNATLVIVGDVNTADVLAKVKTHFGGIPRGPQPVQWVTPEQPQYGERRVTVARQGRVPIVYIGWRVPAITHADIPALMLLDGILGTGRSSRLYAPIVEKGLGVSAWSSTLLLKDAGLFIAGGAAAPGKPLAPIEAAIYAEVARLQAAPPSAEEMARALRMVEAQLIFARDSVTEQADQLGYYATVVGDWKALDRLPAQLRAVTAADIQRVAKTYLIETHRTVGLFQPTTAAPQAGLPAARPAAYRDGDAFRGPEPLRRQGTGGAVRGTPAPKAAVKRARFELPNGLVLIVQENHANPTVAVRANLKAGKAYDPAGKAGTAELVAGLLDHGTTTRSAQQIAAELEGAAAEIEAGTGWETVGMHGKALSGDTVLLMRNLADLIRNPNFPQAELDNLREQSLAGLAQERDQPRSVAYRAFYRAALPAGDPYRVASFDEEEAGLKALTRDDLLAFHRTRYTPKTMTMAVVGDVTIEAVKALVEQYFGDWTGPEPAILPFAASAPGAAQRVAVPVADKSETAIYLGFAGGLRRTDPDYYAAQIMNMILGGGGALDSRLGDVVRDQHGLAYSVGSAFHASTGAGPWYAQLGVNPANADKAITLVQAEITRMRDKGATPQEVRDAVAYLTGSQAIALETNAALAATLMDAEYFHLGLDYPERMGQAFAAVTVPQVNAAAQKYLHPDRLTTVVAGPGAK
jgi:zinc protease